MTTAPPAGGLEMKLTWLLTQNLSRFSRRLGGAAASHLWFTPWRVPPAEKTLARRRAWLEGVEDFPIEAEGRTLAGWRAGEGPPVLLVHGWADEAATLGAFVPALVKEGYTAVGLDMPAHGSSPGRRTDGYRWVAAIEAVVERLGEPVSVIAHSMGALTTSLAIRDGLDVQRAVFISPAVRMTSALATFRRQARLNDEAVAALKRSIERRFGAEVWGTLAMDRLMADSKIPGLVVHDDADDQVPLEDAEAIVAAWPEATLLQTTGLGHNRVLRDDRVIEASLRFLSVQEPSGEGESELVTTG